MTTDYPTPSYRDWETVSRTRSVSQSRYRDIETLELKENGLTLAVIAMVPGKRWNFKSALEAECFVADYLGA